MSQFWTRTRIFLAVVWIGAIAAEIGVVLAVGVIDNSWVLVLFLAILAVPVIATDMTIRWMRRPARTAWARHDLAAQAASAPRMVVEAPTEPGTQSPAAPAA